MNHSPFLTESYLSHSNQFILECKVHGHPKPSISWFRNGTPITEAIDKYVLAESNRNAEIQQLIICNPTKDDSGLYMCEARNTVKTTQISHTVDLKEVLSEQALNNKRKCVNGTTNDERHLSLQSELHDIDIESGATAKFTCRVAGSEPNIVWLKNGHPLDEGCKYFSSINNGVVTLEVLNVDSGDAGTYSCIVRNSFNTVTTSSRLAVSADPSESRHSSKKGIHLSKRFAINEYLSPHICSIIV